MDGPLTDEKYCILLRCSHYTLLTIRATSRSNLLVFEQLSNSFWSDKIRLEFSISYGGANAEGLYFLLLGAGDSAQIAVDLIFVDFIPFLEAMLPACNDSYISYAITGLDYNNNSRLTDKDIYRMSGRDVTTLKPRDKSAERIAYRNYLAAGEFDSDMWSECNYILHMLITKDIDLSLHPRVVEETQVGWRHLYGARNNLANFEYLLKNGYRVRHAMIIVLQSSRLKANLSDEAVALLAKYSPAQGDITFQLYDVEPPPFYKKAFFCMMKLPAEPASEMMFRLGLIGHMITAAQSNDHLLSNWIFETLWDEDNMSYIIKCIPYLTKASASIKNYDSEAFDMMMEMFPDEMRVIFKDMDESSIEEDSMDIE